MSEGSPGTGRNHSRFHSVRARLEAMAVERLGLHPRLVEGREDNLKVTTPADLALAGFLLRGHT